MKFRILFLVLFHLTCSDIILSLASRYAMCLSGGIRTFKYTIPRYIQFLEFNKRDGIDVFLYIADENDNINDIEIKQFLSRPEIKKMVLETKDVFPTLKHELRISCHNPNSNRMLSCVMQAYKIFKCQNLINDYVKTDRNGIEYSLIIRSRPDILFPPQILNLNKFNNIVRMTTEKVIDGSFLNNEFIGQQNLNNNNHNHNLNSTSSSSSPLYSFQKVLQPRFIKEAKTISSYNEYHHDGGESNTYSMHHVKKTSEDSEESISDVINQISYMFIPLCGDWNGVNDQFAIGNSLGMKEYSQRLFTWKHDHPMMRVAHDACEGDSDRHTLMNLLGRIDHTKVFRFVFDYTLLRDKLVKDYLLNPTSYQEIRNVISGGANGLNDIVDVGTVCAKDPTSVTGFKDLKRQHATSGRKEWTAELLKCKLFTYSSQTSSMEGYDGKELGEPLEVAFRSSTLKRTKSSTIVTNKKTSPIKKQKTRTQKKKFGGH